MATLGDNVKILNNINNMKLKAVKVVHFIAFQEDEQPRWLRRRLRRFSGFNFEENSEEFRTKITDVSSTLTLADAISVCHILDIDYQGSKDELLYRICSFFCELGKKLSNTVKTDESKDLKEDDVNEHDEDDEEDENEEDDEEEKNEEDDDEDRKNEEYDEDDENIEDENDEKIETNLKQRIKKEENPRFNHDDRRGKKKPETFSMTFRDIEDSVRCFDGKDGYPIVKWIDEFEEIAEIMEWGDLQKLIFGKKSLKGMAKVLVQAEKGITTWTKLKRILRSEFEVKSSSASIHKLLTERRKQKEESIQEYILIMREIASRANIEEETVIEYIVDGIPDDPMNKSLLYEATTYRELKERTKLYITLKNKVEKRNYQPGRDRPRKDVQKQAYNGSNNETRTEIRCYNCGRLGHRSRDCEDKTKGIKCFRCNRYGHKSFECKEKPEKSKSEHGTAAVNNIAQKFDKMCKKILVNDKELHILVDTGSELNIIRKDEYEALGLTPLTQSDLILNGFGQSCVKSMGHFEGTVVIDEEQYTTRFYVVPKDAMTMKGIIGNELLNQANVCINEDGVRIKKRKNDVEIMNIEVGKEEQIDIGSEASKEAKTQVRNLVNNYKPTNVKTTNLKMKIIMKDEEPISCHPRRLPVVERNIVDNQIDQWLKDGIVEPSDSEYSSQVVIVKKKDGSPRICIDYRKINKSIAKDRYPLPLIEDQLDKLQDSKIFSTIDLKNGFFHVDVEENSRKYTSFVTHMGQYQFKKMPFGLCTSPSMFQRYINHVFRSLINQNIVLQYLDDLIIPAENETQALNRLIEVLKLGEDYGLEINWKKCQFLKRRIEFLGHVIEEGRIYPSPEKVKAVLKYPELKSVKQVQSYLGLTGYFRKFIPSYSTIARPLSNLLKKDAKFKFGEDEKQAFNKLKEILCNKPVLSIYRQEGEIELHTDASKEGYGAILLQKSQEDNQMHPVYYLSRKTNDAEKKYSSYELEVLAIVGALKKFRVYLLGNKFKIVTDCSAFTKTMEKKDLATRVARWAMLLEEYDYEIVHRPGTRMQHVDSLSRNPINVIVTENGMLAKIKIAQEEDPEMRTIKKILDEKPFGDYLQKNNILYKSCEGRETLVIPNGLQTEIIRITHENGHLNAKKVEQLLSQDYYIPQAAKKIQTCITNCVPCILLNRKRGKQEGFLHPLNKVEIPLYTYHVDHLGPLESTNKNYKHIFAVTDAFTKFVWLYPVKTVTAREMINKLEIQKQVFGSPVNIISDRGTAFTSQEFKTYCEDEGIKHYAVTTGLPRANGQIERVNSAIIPVLGKLSIEDPTKWYQFVGKVQQILNASFHRSIGMTPFELMIGTKMKGKGEATIRTLIEKEMQENFEELRHDLRKSAKAQILKVQEENRKYFNRRRKNPRRYKIGDLVAIKRTQQGGGLKLKSKFLGPYQVIKVKAGEAYEVKKEGFHEGPMTTSTCAEYMKPWVQHLPETSPRSVDEVQDGRDVGIVPHATPMSGAEQPSCARVLTINNTTTNNGFKDE